MKKIIALSALLLAVAFTFSSCSKEKQLKKRLVGTWNVDKVAGTVTVKIAGFPDNVQPVDTANAGTIIFKDDATGSNQGGQSMTWLNTDVTVALTDKTDNTTKTYTVTTNEKTRQVWTNTETTTSVVFGMTITYVNNLTITLSKK